MPTLLNPPPLPPPPTLSSTRFSYLKPATEQSPESLFQYPTECTDTYSELLWVFARFHSVYTQSASESFTNSASDFLFSCCSSSFSPTPLFFAEATFAVLCLVVDESTPARSHIPHRCTRTRLICWCPGLRTGSSSWPLDCTLHGRIAVGFRSDSPPSLATNYSWPWRQAVRRPPSQACSGRKKHVQIGTHKKIKMLHRLVRYRQVWRKARPLRNISHSAPPPLARSSVRRPCAAC